MQDNVVYLPLIFFIILNANFDDIPVAKIYIHYFKCVEVVKYRNIYIYVLNYHVRLT